MSIVLLVYALVAGMLVPLRPGIHTATPSSAKTGQLLELNVEGYNTSFEGDDIVGWLKLEGEFFLQSETTEISDNQNLTLKFQLPSQLPGQDRIMDATLIMDSEMDGTTVLPSAVFISTDEQEGVNEAHWLKNIPERLAPKDGFYFPYRNILVETIRNTFYHVSLWFAMFILLMISVIYSIKYLIKRHPDDDRKSYALVLSGVLFGLLGLATGAIWAKFTWGTFWTTDVKLNMAAISMLIYLGYLLLRHSIEDRDRRATLSASYAIFAYVAMIPLLFVVPRLTDSLHPGNGGNPGLGGEDLDHTLRIIFYPAIIGFTLLGLWLAQLYTRVQRIKDHYLGL